MNPEKRYISLQHEVAQIAKRCGRNPGDIAVVGVTKGYAWDKIRDVYDQGCRDFGESRVQEVFKKQAEAPEDIRWHFIGTLQKNKVKDVIGKFVLIHSVDSPELAKLISNRSMHAHVVTDVLLEVNTSGELSKHGLHPEEWKNHIEEVSQLPGIRVNGLMTMAPLTDDEGRIRYCFELLRLFRDELKGVLLEHPIHHLSMGMSQDYPIAIAEGATLLRIGTKLFKT